MSVNLQISNTLTVFFIFPFKANFSAVLQHAVSVFQSKYEYFFKNITNMDELFEVSFTKLSETGKPMSRYVFLFVLHHCYILKCYLEVFEPSENDCCLLLQNQVQP